MRLEEIEGRSAGERRVERLKADAERASERARQLRNRARDAATTHKARQVRATGRHMSNPPIKPVGPSGLR